ncbi:tyrosine-protein kinase family protein [Granulicella tundricola]|nr:capsular exopolysaccharide family protein [Granulicella tundricola]
MRRPGLAANFTVASTGIGLSSILAGSATIQQAVQSVSEPPGLFILPCWTDSTIAHSDSHAAINLMRTLSEGYDIVIIDSPPALGLADSTLLAKFADAIGLVLSYTEFNKAQVRRAKN